MVKRVIDFFDAALLLPLMTLIFVFVFAAQVSAATENARINRYVIAISANYGGDARPTLRYAETDAKSFAKVLGEMGGVPSQNVVFVKEPSIKNCGVREGTLHQESGEPAGHPRRKNEEGQVPERP